MKLILTLACIALIGCTNPNKTDRLIELGESDWSVSYGNDGWAVYYYILAPDSHDYIAISRGGICHAEGCRKCKATK